MKHSALSSLNTVSRDAWNALVEPGNPFMQYEFLAALERSGCIGAGMSWSPRYIFANEKDQIRAAAAAFVRSDSYGEYIFDWAWANAYEQAGLSYYPKITVAAPFTPATGRRLLSGRAFDEKSASSLLTALDEVAAGERASGIHFLCLTREEQKFLSAAGYLPRITHQYHWLNRGFTSFDDYLDNLRSHRRKEIRRERRKAQELGLEIQTLTGSEIREEHMRAMFAFYVQTYSRKWGSPYLNLACFLELWKTMADRLVLVLAFDGKEAVAGSIAFRKDDRLFGRYWGAKAHYPFLHFELCFYRLIDFAIAEKISLFEAGAQGEHKFQRGFTAMPVYSSHKLFHPQGASAIAHFLARERKATMRALRAYRAASPLKMASMPAADGHLHAPSSPNKDELQYLPEFEGE